MAFLGLWMSVALASAQGLGKLEISVEPLFLDQPSSQETVPALITVTNEGPDTRGFILIRASGATITTPIDLPKGAEKAVIAYVPSNDSQPVPITLETGAGSASAEFRVDGSESIPQVLIVTDTPGIGTFLRKRPPMGTPRVRRWEMLYDTYASPDRLPDRVVGYSPVAAVVLADGYERITDQAAETLKLYVLTGGTLVFVGGTRGSVAERAPWNEILPVSQLEVQNVNGSQVKFSSKGISVTDRTVSLSLGRLHPHAKKTLETAYPLVTTRAHGAGRVVHLAFNPFDVPLSRLDERRDLFTTMIPANESTGRALTNLMYIESPDNYGASYGGPYGGTPPAGTTTKSDPFSASMPPTSTILTILFAYFLIVGPLNLIVLKKMNRGELAWITGPALSLIFAAIFFQYAGNLYGAGLSRQTTAVVLAQSGVPSAYAVGQSQVFFPSGGRFDLKLPEGAEKIWTQTRDYDFGSRTPAIPVVDVGQLAVPSMPVSNLSFQHFSYRQRVTSTARIETELSISKPGAALVARGWVHNMGPQRLEKSQLVVRGSVFQLGKLEPGQRLSVEATGQDISTSRGFDGIGSYLAALSRERWHQDQVAVIGDVVDIDSGPQIGKSTERSKTQLVVFTSNRRGAQ